MRPALTRPTPASVVVGSLSLALPVLAGVPAAAGATAVHGAVAASSPSVQEIPVRVPARVVPGRAVLTAPQKVQGFGVVGATWLGATPPGLRLDVRTETGGAWSGWESLSTSDVAAGDPAASGPTRTGTDPVAVGDVDAVQLRAASTTGRAPRDLELSVVDPGTSPVDTAPAGRRTTERATDPEEPVPGIRAPHPRIRLRAAWGADRRMRTGRPQYGEVDAAFVHHTVNANDYAPEDVPAIIRGIYAYHTQSLGWSDIGYNFLVDRFGRIWVGRAGGPRKPVIGAQVYGYNHLSTGVSVIGNFEEAKPSRRVLRAVGHLLGWKLGLHDVAVPTRASMNEETYGAINGHRDAGQTLCPGKYLYKRLPAIRRFAAAWQER